MHACNRTLHKKGNQNILASHIRSPVYNINNNNMYMLQIKNKFRLKFFNLG